MRNVIISLLFATSFIACNTALKDKSNQSAMATDSLQEPDIYVLRQRLFDYFERHKHEDAFDTTDDTYYRYWGYSYRPNTVEAGHLLCINKTHAVIRFSDSLNNGIFVFLKDKREWNKIFEDTTLEIGIDEHPVPYYKDWNGDGIKDISVSNTYPTDYTERFRLYLSIDSGRQIVNVRGFENIYNPEVDSNNMISSVYAHAGNFLAGKYVINKDTIKELRLIHIYPLSDNGKDSLCAVFSENGKTKKTIKSTGKGIVQQIPAQYQKDVEDYFLH